MINTNCRNRIEIEDVFVKLEHYFKVSSLWAYHRFPIYELPDHEIEPRIENWNPSHHVLDKKYERFIGNKSKFYLPLEIRVRLAQSCIHIFDISNRTYRYRYHL